MPRRPSLRVRSGLLVRQRLPCQADDLPGIPNRLVDATVGADQVHRPGSVVDRGSCDQCAVWAPREGRSRQAEAYTGAEVAQRSRLRAIGVDRLQAEGDLAQLRIVTEA